MEVRSFTMFHDAAVKFPSVTSRDPERTTTMSSHLLRKFLAFRVVIIIVRDVQTPIPVAIDVVVVDISVLECGALRER